MKARDLAAIACLAVASPAVPQDVGHSDTLDTGARNYYTKENILKFAGFLYQNGDYERAAGEYGRVMALCPDAGLKDTLAYTIAVADIRLLKTALSRKYCSTIPADTADSLLGVKAACLYAYSYYLENKFDTCADLAARAALLAREGEWKQRAAQIRIGALLRQHCWREASVEAGKAMDDFKGTGDDTLTRRLYAVGMEGTKFRPKNAGFAGFLSAVVPGSGKAYAGRPWDGLSSFFLIGILAWQSYEGYRKDGPVSGRCITFGLLGSGFYAGNIYGSMTAARLYNSARRRAICDRINLRFNW
jgi:hypothetical protein